MFFKIPSSVSDTIITPIDAKAITHIYFEPKNDRLWLADVDNSGAYVTIQIDGKTICDKLLILPFCTQQPTPTCTFSWRDVAIEVNLNVSLSEIKIKSYSSDLGYDTDDFNIVFVCSRDEVDETKGFEYFETKRITLCSADRDGDKAVNTIEEAYDKKLVLIKQETANKLNEANKETNKTNATKNKACEEEFEANKSKNKTIEANLKKDPNYYSEPDYLPETIDELWAANTQYNEEHSEDADFKAKQTRYYEESDATEEVTWEQLSSLNDACDKEVSDNKATNDQSRKTYEERQKEYSGYKFPTTYSENAEWNAAHPKETQKQTQELPTNLRTDYDETSDEVIEQLKKVYDVGCLYYSKLSIEQLKTERAFPIPLSVDIKGISYTWQKAYYYKYSPSSGYWSTDDKAIFAVNEEKAIWQRVVSSNLNQKNFSFDKAPQFVFAYQVMQITSPKNSKSECIHLRDNHTGLKVSMDGAGNEVLPDGFDISLFSATSHNPMRKVIYYFDEDMAVTKNLNVTITPFSDNICGSQYKTNYPSLWSVFFFFGYKKLI